MKLSALYQIFLDCAVVTTDSRNCPAGSLSVSYTHLTLPTKLEV